MLTKSLHTVTAVTKVALYMARDVRTDYRNAAELTVKALFVLGYDADSIGPQDATVLACHKAVTKALTQDVQS